jgi:hypothetical protein
LILPLSSSSLIPLLQNSPRKRTTEKKRNGMKARKKEKEDISRHQNHPKKRYYKSKEKNRIEEETKCSILSEDFSIHSDKKDEKEEKTDFMSLLLRNEWIHFHGHVRR